MKPRAPGRTARRTMAVRERRVRTAGEKSLAGRYATDDRRRARLNFLNGANRGGRASRQTSGRM
ncbi:hypothetical protein EZV77_06070 [Burkholderia thailandensis]|nr:hypothetical protein CWD92_31480 [Burkholderia thailandensis]TBW66484.1 hypothetical protein EZV77_06070 [Burkholderia thailandensis]